MCSDLSTSPGLEAKQVYLEPLALGLFAEKSLLAGGRVLLQFDGHETLFQLLHLQGSPQQLSVLGKRRDAAEHLGRGARDNDRV